MFGIAVVLFLTAFRRVDDGVGAAVGDCFKRCAVVHFRQVEDGIVHRMGGVGEVGVPPAAPALANALAALKGKRFRSLPLSREVAFA